MPNRDEYFWLAALKSVLDGSESPSVPDGIDWPRLLGLAKRQELLPITAAALKNSREPIPPEVRASLEAGYQQAIFVEAIRAEEIESVFSEFCRANISFLPLKGWVLKRDYPEPHLRTMTDVDLLVPEEFFLPAQKVLAGAGFRSEGSGSLHAIFRKPPVCMVELHHRLFHERHAKVPFLFRERFDSAALWPKTLPGTSGDYERVLSEEDFATFILLHFLKHFTAGGAGVRFLLDMEVLRRRAKVASYSDLIGTAGLDRSLVRFVAAIDHVGRKWFGEKIAKRGPKEFSEEFSEELEDFLLGGGLLGSARCLAASRIGSHERTQKGGFTKIRFLLGRIFPPRSEMVHFFPIIRRWPIFLPVAWIRLNVRRIFGEERRAILTYLKAIRQSQSSDQVQLKAFYSRLGLDSSGNTNDEPE